MSRIAILSVLLAMLASNSVHAQRPGRVVSLDFCADQYVLKLLPRSRILAVSPDAKQHFSYMRASADGLRQVRPVAEDILTIQPDLIVRSYGGGPQAARFFERAGIHVLQVPFANSLADIRSAVIEVAAVLDVAERGLEIARDMDRRLANIRPSSPARTTLYMTPTGVTSGPGSLIHAMLIAAGRKNFEERSGWHSLPLERLVYEQPDHVAASFFDSDDSHVLRWSAMRHPIARRQLGEQPTVMLPGAWTSCGGWFLMDAVEELAAE